MTATSAGYTIRQWPSDERPRERLESQGPRALASRELLALLIETGRPATETRAAVSAMDLAANLLRKFSVGERESLRRIMTASRSEICEVYGVGPAKATKILAALELGRRAAEEERGPRERIRTPRDVYERMRLRLRDLPHEEFHVLLLNTQNEVLRDVAVTRGTLDASLVHPREVFRPAILEPASSVVLVHNHPSGDPTPSPEDRSVTTQLRQAGETVGIDVIDHVIVGEGRYVSFVEAGLWGS